MNLLTKFPLNVHSCCNLMRTEPNSSGIRAAESSSCMVRDAKTLRCQAGAAAGMRTGPSFGGGATVVSSRTGPSSDTLQRFTRLLNGRFPAV